MKTHHESVWIDAESLRQVDEYGMHVSAVSSKQILAIDLEFVPASVYVELKTRLEKAEYSANGFESLYDAAREENNSLKVRLEEREMQLADAISVANKVLDELATANAQLQTKTENMRELREFVETIASSAFVDSDDIICRAQALIFRIASC